MDLVTHQGLKKELIHQLDLLLVTILAPIDITQKRIILLNPMQMLYDSRQITSSGRAPAQVP